MSYEPVTIGEAARLEVLLFVSLAFLGGLAIVYWGFQTYRFGTTIRDTPTEAIRSVAMGRTEVVGAVVPADRVYDQPFIEGRCVYAEVEVEEYRENRHDDDEDPEWVTVQSETVVTPFHVEDDTGRILIEPTGETIFELSDDLATTIQVDGHETPPAPVQEFLTPGGSTDEVTDDSGGLRAWLAGVGNTLTLGKLWSDSDSDESSDSDAGDAAADASRAETETGSASADEAEARTNDSESIEADGGELNAVTHVSRDELGTPSPTSRDRRYAQRVLPVEDEAYVFGGATQRPPDEVSDLAERETIGPDPSTGEFIVSDRGEFDLAREYRKRSLVYIVAGIIASCIVLALLVQILITGPVYGIDYALP